MTERLNFIREILESNKIDALLVTNPVNRRYLSGFRGSAGVLLISPDQAYLVTDFRYTEQAAAQAPGFEVLKWKDDLYEFVAEIVDKKGWETVGFESAHVVFSLYDEIKEKLPVKLVPLKETAEKRRMIKDAEEIDLMRSGAKVIDGAFDYLRSAVQAGMTEREVAIDLEIYLLKQGMEEKSFSYIVASGERGAMPHGLASDKVIRAGEMITIDFGGVFNGYSTDMTRTMALKKVDQRQGEIYDIVYSAQRKACASVKPGMKASELDAVARDLINDAGCGDYFGHGLGHGIGLETHEKPVLNHRSETILEPGMVITVEPGIYIPAWGGVRIEDMLVVTEEGAESLTESPRELTVI